MRNKKTFIYLLFIIYYLLFIIYYLLFIIYYLLFIIYYLLFIIYYLLFIIYYLLYLKYKGVVLDDEKANRPSTKRCIEVVVHGIDHHGNHVMRVLLELVGYLASFSHL
jgi:hypothetical protein